MADEREHGGGVDDCPATLGNHFTRRGHITKKDALRVHRHHLVPSLLSFVLRRGTAWDSGIGHHDIDSSKPLTRFLDEAVYLAFGLIVRTVIHDLVLDRRLWCVDVDCYDYNSHRIKSMTYVLAYTSI